MSLQTAMDALRPIATIEFYAVALLPYVALVLLAMAFGYVMLHTFFGDPGKRRPDDTANGE